MEDVLTPAERETLIERALETEGGRLALAGSMANPIRMTLDYQSIGRKLVVVDPLPQGALPIYDKDIKVPAVVVGKRGRVPDSLQEGERVTVPLFEIASYPQVRFSQAKARRFNLIDRAQQRAKLDLMAIEDRNIFNAIQAAAVAGVNPGITVTNTLSRTAMLSAMAEIGKQLAPHSGDGMSADYRIGGTPEKTLDNTEERPDNPNVMKGPSAERIRDEYWNEGLSTEKIARNHGCSRQQINKLMKIHGIPTYSDLQKIDLTDVQKGIVIGSVLGDAYITGTRQGKARIGMGHSWKQEEYLVWKSIMLAPFMTRRKMNVVTNKDGYRICKTWSYVHPFFGEMLGFYRNRKKFVNADLTDRYFNEYSLAIWYMDDGCLKNGRTHSFATASFGEYELHLLSRIVMSKTGIRIVPYRNGKYFYMKVVKDDRNRFESMIRKIVIPCMSYKMIGCQESVETKRSPSGSQSPEEVIVRPYG